MPTNNPARQRLAEFVRRDRARRYSSRREFAAAIHISKRTVDKLETGQGGNYAPATRARVESGLRWEDGSIEIILGGGSPTYLTDPLLDELVEEIWPRLSQQARVLLLRYAREAVSADP